MDIYEYAMQMEKDGEQYYRETSKKAGNKGIKSILMMLADAEVKHYHIFSSMKNNEKVQAPDTPILTDVKNIFVTMREEKDTTGVNVSQIALYKKAQELETKTRDFYLEKSGEVKDQSQKKIFLKIADEEKNHYSILETIIDFVSRPEQWLEDPEWYHLEEY